MSFLGARFWRQRGYVVKPPGFFYGGGAMRSPGAGGYYGHSPYRWRGKRVRAAYRKKLDVAKTALAAIRGVRRIERQQEYKWYADHNSVVITVPIGGAAQVVGLGPYMQQGVTNATRIGNKVTVRSLRLRFFLQPGAAPTIGTAIRLLIVYDKRPNGVLAGVLDVLEADDVKATYQLAPASRGRFKVLADRTFTFQTTDCGKFFNWTTRKMHNFRYDGNAGDVTDLDRGNLFLIGVGEAALAAAFRIECAYEFRYTDD